MSECFSNDGSPKCCPCCGSTWFYDKIYGYSEWGRMEFEVFCMWCGDSLAYWAYGSYNPSYRDIHV